MPHTYEWTPEAIKATPSSTVQIRTWDNKPVPEAYYSVNVPVVSITVPSPNRYKITLRTNGDTETARLDIPQAQNSTSLEERVRKIIQDAGISEPTTPATPEITTQAELTAAISAANPGAVLDLKGRTIALTSGLNISKTLNIRNATLTAANMRVAIVTAADCILENVKFIRTGTGRTGSESALTLNAPRTRLDNVTAISTVGEGLRMGNGTCNGTKILGGHYECSDQNDAVPVHLVSGPAHNYDVFLSGATIRHSGYGTGIAFYNCSRSTVQHSNVTGIRATPWYTFPSTDWTLSSGTVYRIQDRADTGSNAVWVDGVEYKKQYDTTTPALNFYSNPGDGYFYINTGGNPNTKVVRTRRTNGYGILFYATTSESLGMSDNLIAHNHVEDVDGFGIYYQTLQNVPRNNRTLKNTLKNVCKMGIAVNDLPFAGIGVFGGLDVQLEGDYIDGAGTAEYPCPGIDFKASVGTPLMSGRIHGVTVRNASSRGIQLAPGIWDLNGVTVENSAGHGFGAGTITSTDELRATFTNCVATNNVLSGLHYETTSAAYIRITILGGRYTHNQRNIVLVRNQDSYIGAGVYSSNGSSYGVSIGGLNRRMIIDGLNLGPGQGLSVTNESTDLFLGAVNHDNSTGTKLNIAVPYRVGGVRGYGSEMWAGTGTPEGVLAAPVGSSYRRTDGTTGATLYIKESGTGNTGWIAK